MGVGFSKVRVDFLKMGVSFSKMGVGFLKIRVRFKNGSVCVCIAFTTIIFSPLHTPCKIVECRRDL